MHAYLNHNMAHLAPFSYTKFKIPLANERKDLTPFEPKKKMKLSGSTPVIKELNKEYKSLKKDTNQRKNKIKSLISERNEREYYLSLNTNHYKVKLRHLKNMHNSIQAEIDKKINDKKRQLLLFNRQLSTISTQSSGVSAHNTQMLFKKGMSEAQLTSFMKTQRKFKFKQFNARQAVKEVERELQQLEFKKTRYKNEFDRRISMLKVEESERKNMYLFNYDKVKAKSKVETKRGLLHDTLHSNLRPNHRVTAYETKEGEQFTLDLLRKAEEKDLEEQQKFLESLLQKDLEEKRLKAEQRAKLRKRLASARPFNYKLGERKERCLSAIMKKKEQLHLSNQRKPYIPPEMQVGLHSIQPTWKLFDSPNPLSTQHKTGSLKTL